MAAIVLELKAVGYWQNKKVLIPGGSGFIGSHVVEELLRRSPNTSITVIDRLTPAKRRNLALVKKKVKLIHGDLNDPRKALSVCRGKDVVINLAAAVNGVGWNSQHPASLFRDNMIIALNLLDAAIKHKVSRFVVVSSASIYPGDAQVPTPETEGFRGLPEKNSAGYGWAKRMAEYAAQAYAQEHGLEVAIVRPFNTYGPRGHFEENRAHVISALITRVCRGDNPVTVWGDGQSTRSFLYVEDAACGILDVAEKYAKADPINIGDDYEISIRDLAQKILHLSGCSSNLSFDQTKPSGQTRSSCDTNKAQKILGYKTKVSLDDGLLRTIRWYKENELPRHKTR